MTDLDKAIGEGIGWRHAVTWCVGGTAALCLFFAGYMLDGVRTELRDMNAKLDVHSERIVKVETKEENLRVKVASLEDNLFTHLYDSIR